MRTTDPGDAARIELLLAELRLPAVKQVWVSLAAQADKEGWPAGRFLAYAMNGTSNGGTAACPTKFQPAYRISADLQIIHSQASNSMLGAGPTTP
jgi:hypothetical protein